MQEFLQKIKFQSISFYNRLNSFPLALKVLLALSFPVKCYYLFSHGFTGPDAHEYVKTAQLFEGGITDYLVSSNPYTFWRMPFLPLVIYLCQSLYVFYLLQILLSYFLSYNFYRIFLKVTGKTTYAVIAGTTILFLPYLNISCCEPLSEFLQVFFIVWIFRKVIYNQFDWIVVACSAMLILLRPEGFTFVLLLLAREVFLLRFKNTVILLIPLLIAALWMFRNFKVFDSFSLNNPIHSSRAMVSSLYNSIYVQPAAFHLKYNYYNGMDYKNSKEFIKEYKEVARHELSSYIINHPVEYCKHRLYWVYKSFTYTNYDGSFNYGVFDWPRKEYSWQMVSESNAVWSFANLIESKSYFKLCIRILYSGLWGFGHTFGLLLFLINFKKLKVLSILFIAFSYVFIVEADMRYFYTVQAICFSLFMMFMYQSVINRKLTFKFI